MVMNKDMENEWEVVGSEEEESEGLPTTVAPDSDHAMSSLPLPIEAPAIKLSVSEPDIMVVDSESTPIEIESPPEDAEGMGTAQFPQTSESVESSAMEETVPNMTTEDDVTPTTNDTHPTTESFATSEQHSKSTSVPPSMEDPRGPGEALLSLWGSSVRALGAFAQDIEDQHHIGRKTKNSVEKVGQVLQELENEHHIQRKTRNSFKTVGRFFHNNLKQVSKSAEKAYREAQVEEKAAQVRVSLSRSAKDLSRQAATINEEYRVTETLAAASVIGAGALLAKGNTKGVAGVLAAGGAAYVAGEALKQPYQHDANLNEDLHLD